MEVTKANYVEGLPVRVTFESGLEEGDGDDTNTDSDSGDERFDLEFEDEVDIGITEYLDALHLENSSGDSSD
ncbi:hypothetical protein PQX77_022281 [Marasmius sp. AFHP31]|nr:hypothetical protein PQX77_022281 [Marasmius sp. AFHP31]